MTWLLDTLVWTGALIALVLFVRRPVSRLFGAGTAYALWLLPLLRLALPPLVLPAPVAGPQPVALSSEELVILVQAAGPGEPAMPAAPSAAWLPDLSHTLLTIWLVGALAYVALRLVAYGRLRSELLGGARAVGNAGKIRLLETAATRSPLAFGVFDKVIALPPGFMAWTDRTARDLALEHELAHHRAHDLAVNFAALPLFAMHWFNPLSWLGWTAMRRDQEAACDARVVAGRGRDERARYAALIAGAAAAPRAALAAPMACPVLGDKSIVQRLRNLAMTDLSQRRRRAGGLLVGLGALMLPLTASVTYAQMAEPGDDTPRAIEEVPLPPSAALSPVAPEAPEAPDAPRVQVERIVIDKEPGEGDHTFVIRHPDGARAPNRVIHLNRKDGKVLTPDSPEFDAHMKLLEKRLSRLDKDIEIRMLEDTKRIRELTDHAVRVAMVAPRVEMNCDGPDGEPRDAEGRQVIRLCHARMMATATAGLRSARAAIAASGEMDAETRSEILESLDSEIERLEDEAEE